MKNNLVIIAHPNITQSRGNKALKNAIVNEKNITIHELYKEYPDNKIDVKKEIDLLLSHDNIVLQFPFYWYSVPPLLKQWLDEVLVGDLFKTSIYKSDVLYGKKLQLAITSGKLKSSYLPPKKDDSWNDRTNRPYLKPSLVTKYGNHIIEALLMPLEQTAHLIGMQYPQPFIIHAVMPASVPIAITEEELVARANEYKELIKKL